MPYSWNPSNQPLAPPPQGSLSSSSEVLIVGDSHSTGCFATEMFNGLKKVAPKVSLYAVGGATAEKWLSGWNRNSSSRYATCVAHGSESVITNSQKRGLCEDPFPVKSGLPSFSQILSSRPRLSIIALGTNILLESQKYGKAKALASIDEMIQKLREQGSDCIWVGPPQPGTCSTAIAAYESFNRDLKKVVEAKGCTFVDSNTKTNRGNLKGDCLHYYCEFAGKWGREVVKEIGPGVANIFKSSSSTEKGQAGATP